MRSITDKGLIWIIGASTGIGAELAKAYAAMGYHCVISSRSVDKLTALNNKSLHGQATIIPFDVTDKHAIRLAVNKVSLLKKYIAKTIINAGICEYVDVDTLTISPYERVMSANFFGAVAITEQLLPLITQQTEKSQLVFTSSSVSYQPLPRASAYGASKAALSYFAESIKTDLQHTNVDVRVISPGFVDTPLTQQNDFPMPALTSTQKAAENIVTGLDSRRFDIHFPARFTWALKLVSLLPQRLKFGLLGKLSRQTKQSTLTTKTR